MSRIFNPIYRLAQFIQPIILSLLILALALRSSGVRAASGDLDTTFGLSSSGVNFTNLGGGEKAFGIALQNDNKIVVVGTDNTHFVVARYTSAGLLDTASFGSGLGYVTTAIGDAATAFDVAIQSDGKIVVAGTAATGPSTYFAVARYQTNGQLDTTFNSTGIVTSTLGTGVNDAAHAIVIDTNNKLLVAGSVDRDFAVVRYTSTGALDTSFGSGGLATADFIGSNDEGWDLETTSDNKILVAGFADTGSSDDFGVVRFTPSGNLDTTFGGGDGIVNTDFGGQSNDQALGMDLQPDGKIVLAGLRTPAGGGASTDFALARYTADGSLDLTFDSDGRVVTDFAGLDEEAYDVHVQPTGRIVAVGFTFSSGATVQDFALARYLSNGALDTSFGASGLVATNLGTQLPENSNTQDYAYAAAIQPDNKIVIAGLTDYPVASGDDNLAIARYESPNTAPTVANFSKSGTEDTTLNLSAADFTAAFSDADGDTLQKIQVTSLSANGTLKLNGVNVTLNQEIMVGELDNLDFVPNSNFFGSTSFSWNGSDGLDYAASAASANLTFSGVNDAPVLNAIGNQSGNELSLITFTASATDVDGDTLSYTIDAGAPSGASINSTSGVFTWTPTELQGPGVYNVTVRVTDNGVPGLSDFETIQITVNEVNTAPVLNAIGSKSIAEGSQLTFTASATDSDVPANTLSYSLGSGAPAGASINAASGEFTWTPGEAEGPGVYTVTVQVSDNGNPVLSDSEAVRITVSEVNVAPVLNAIGDQSVSEGVELTFTASASDSDLPANTLTYSLDAGAPTGAAINASSGVFTWTPGEAQGPGNYPITVRVTDSGSPALSDSETITVTVSEVNQAPVLSTIGNKTIGEESLLTFTASASDADLPANSLSYSLDPGAPLGASINAASGEFTWTPTEDQGPGVYTLTVRVADNGTPVLEDAETLTITVNEVNKAPTLADINKTVAFTETVAFSAADFVAAFSDAEGNSLVEVKITSLPAYGVLTLNAVPVVVNQVVPAAELGGLLFTQQNGWFGATSFTWNASDGQDYAVLDAQALITVGSPPGAVYLPVVMLRY